MLPETESNPYLWSETANRLRDNAAKKNIPLIGTFELTARCNLSCRMCYIRRPSSDLSVSAQELSARDWIRLGKECRDNGTLYLLLTGGEPFLRSDLKQIYEALSEMGLILTLYTNGTKITDETVGWLSRRPPSKVTVTLYGASEETYRKLCGDGSAFDRVLFATRRLKEAGINVNVRSTITKSNLHDLENMRRLCEDQGLPFTYSCMIFKPVRGAVSDASKERLSPAQIISLREAELPPDFSDPDDCVSIEKRSRTKEPMSCTGGKCSWWITWNGRMVPCSLMDTPSASVRQAAFTDAWETIKNSIKGIPSAPACSDCGYWPYCSVCPGVLQAETGSFEQTSDYICDFAYQVKNSIYCLHGKAYTGL